MPHQIDGTWSFNGDMNVPTFRPSYLTWWDEGDPPVPKRCHSFIKEGRIQFLSDCTHALADQTVEIPDWESA